MVKAPIIVEQQVKVENKGQDKAAAALAKSSGQLTQKLAAMSAQQVAFMATAASTAVAFAGSLLLTVGAASKFETAFAGIRKTVNATEKQFDTLQLQVRQLATEIPISTNQLASIGELGGQLGVSVKGLDDFIETIAKLGVATRMSTESAALGLARMSEIFELQEEEIDNLASSLVDLGNNFAALEDEILNTALRLAAGGKVAGATAADVLGIATALQAVGVQSQAGGTAFARIFQQMTIAASGGTSQLDAFSKVMELTNQEVKDLITSDPSAALTIFVKGLQRVSQQGGNVVAVLEELDLKQQRTIRALLATAEAGDLLAEAITRANIAYVANVALNDEAAKRFETLNSQTKLMKNQFRELAIEIGNMYLPLMKAVVSSMEGFAEALAPSATAQDKNTKTMMKLLGVLALFQGALIFVALGWRTIAKAATANIAPMKILMGRTKAAQAKLKQLGIAARFTSKMFLFLQRNLIMIAPALIAVTIAVSAVMFQIRKAQEAGERFVEVMGATIPARKQILELEKQIADLMNKGANKKIIDLKKEELDMLKQITAELEEQARLKFIEASGRVAPPEIDDATAEFDEFLKAQAELGEDSPWMVKWTEALGLTMDEGIKIAMDGTNTVLETLTLLDHRVVKQLGRMTGMLTSGYVSSFGSEGRVGNPIAEAMADMGKEDMKGFDGQLEKMVERYNEWAEANGKASKSIEEVKGSTTSLNEMLVTLAETTDANGNVTKTLEARVDELVQGFRDANDAAQTFTGTLSGLSPIVASFGSDMIASLEETNMRMIHLNEIVLMLVNEGFPALAKAVMEKGPAEGIGLGLELLKMSSAEMEGQQDLLIKTNEELRDYRDANGEVAQLMLEQLESYQNQFTNSERINASIHVRRQLLRSIHQQEVSAVQEIFQMEQARVSSAEGVQKARERIRDLTQDLVYDNIRITQQELLQLEVNEAIAGFKQAIFEHGEEGVVTASEQLAILRKQAQLDKMRDKISMKMTARERKSIRDKEKEVKFLELAVEQGVAEQLDLDAAKEELDELKNPISQAEMEMLKLEETIVASELAVLEARKASMSPAVISAMESVITAKEAQRDRNKEIKKAENELGTAIAANNILLAQQGIRLGELEAKFGDLDKLVMRVGLGIGIPANILRNTLNSMQTAWTQYQSYMNSLQTNPAYQSTAHGYRWHSLPNQGASTSGYNWWQRGQGNTSGWQYVNSMTGAVGPYNMNKRSSGITNMFGNPDLNRAYGGKVPMGRTSTVGELGPERIMSLPGGGTMVFPNKMGGGKGISVANLNVNITGLPADPITARKVALNIRKELVKLDKEGSGGGGLRNR